MSDRDENYEAVGIFDVISPGLMGEFFEEIETNPILAGLLDQLEYDPEAAGQQQERMEYAISQLLAGEEGIIERAKKVLIDRDVPICPVSCELLRQSGIHPVGAVALACSRGVGDPNKNRMPTRFRIPEGPNKGKWVIVDHIQYKGGTRIGMMIPISKQVQWGDTEPHLNLDSEIDLPESLITNLIGKKATAVIDSDLLGDFIVKEKRTGSKSFNLERLGSMETIGWLLEQNYPAFERTKELRATMEILTMLHASDFDAESTLDKLKRLHANAFPAESGN